MKFDPKTLAREVSFRAVRSSGPGGQHVNKVSTKMELTFDIMASRRLSENQKALLLDKLRSRITSAGLLKLTCDTERSQLANKIRVFQHFYTLVNKALIRPKKRIPSKPSAASREKRLQEKKQQAEKKGRRKRVD
jgi:ribosome-associated protein